MCAILGFVNSRILFVIAMIPSMEQVTVNEMFYYLINGGLVFYGGLFGVIEGIIIVSKFICFDARDILNFVTPAFPLFHFWARIGCLLAGCCYGVEWNWGIIIAGGEDIIRFPTQLVESMCNIFIFTNLVLRERNRKVYKHNLLIYLSSYALCRFILEFYRGDQIRGLWYGGLSTAQYISVFILVICCIYFFCVKWREKGKLGISEKL